MTGRPPQSQGSYDTDRGIWYQVAAGDFAHRAALFLDRDGVIVEDTRYLGKPENVRMLPGAADAIARCNALRIPVVLVSNQSGIARRYYDWDGFHAVQAALAGALQNAGARLDAIFACAYHADGSARLNVGDHPWRKPNPGMILSAVEHMKLDPARSWIVGDRNSDIAAGRAARLRGGILLSRAEQTLLSDATARHQSEEFRQEIADSLSDAVSLLLARGNLAPPAG
ncbi:MAG TPA: HAD family hydrolase [Xanthobacteraceae bacterium]|nr:HAD family hydrolase [Xanthobacteraceae bacterium]